MPGLFVGMSGGLGLDSVGCFVGALGDVPDPYKAVGVGVNMNGSFSHRSTRSESLGSLSWYVGISLQVRAKPPFEMSKHRKMDFIMFNHCAWSFRQDLVVVQELLPLKYFLGC